MKRTLIIGFGNPVRTDDAFGWRVAEALSGHFQPDDHIEFVTCQQLNPELAEDVARSARVIFIDASCSVAPGMVECRALAPAATSSFTHHVDPECLLAGAIELYGSCPEAWLIAVGADSLCFGRTLSPRVEAALTIAVERALELIGAHA